ncbi:hypothetical protein OG381_47980 [Streptomyces sp. NBC_00490]|uniref:hypothetical protein n=1 Tax=Streptomyces sp. NBC_00490 TaxID=2903657 RepID=UPI002E17E1E2
MDTVEILTSLGSAAIGAAAAVGGGYWSFRRVARESRQEQLGAEVAALRAVDMELAVALEIAEERSPTALPTQMLVAALPSIHHMTDAQRAKLIEYSQSALRYNGRVERLVAYGAGKRAFGRTPGAEKPESQAVRVLAAGPPASQAISDHLSSSRFRAQERTGGAA